MNPSEMVHAGTDSWVQVLDQRIHVGETRWRIPGVRTDVVWDDLAPRMCTVNVDTGNLSRLNPSNEADQQLCWQQPVTTRVRSWTNLDC